MMTFSSLSPGGLDGPDLFEQIVHALSLSPADVDDHVDLVRAVLHGVPAQSLALGVVAVGEADDGADRLAARHISRLLHIGSGVMRTDAVVGDAVVAEP